MPRKIFKHINISPPIKVVILYDQQGMKRAEHNQLNVQSIKCAVCPWERGGAQQVKALSGWHRAHLEPHHTLCGRCTHQCDGTDPELLYPLKTIPMYIVWRYLSYSPCLLNSPCCQWRTIHTICRGHQNSQGWDVPVKIEAGTCFKTIWNCYIAQAVWCNREKHKERHSLLS